MAGAFIRASRGQVDKKDPDDIYLQMATAIFMSMKANRPKEAIKILKALEQGARTVPFRRKAIITLTYEDAVMVISDGLEDLDVKQARAMAEIELRQPVVIGPKTIWPEDK